MANEPFRLVAFLFGLKSGLPYLARVRSLSGLFFRRAVPAARRKKQSVCYRRYCFSSRARTRGRKRPPDLFLSGAYGAGGRSGTRTSTIVVATFGRIGRETRPCRPFRARLFPGRRTRLARVRSPTASGRRWYVGTTVRQRTGGRRSAATDSHRRINKQIR